MREPGRRRGRGPCRALTTTRLIWPLVAGQPEVRRNRGRYIVNDEPVGDYSAVATVTTIP